MGHVKRVVVGTVGGILLLTGIALLVLPGPGLLLVLSGLVLLAKAVPSLQRHVAPVRARAMKAAADSVASPWRIAGSVLAGLGLLASGLVVGLGLIPELPVSGWTTGASLIVSSAILFVLLVWSHRAHRPGVVAPAVVAPAAAPVAAPATEPAATAGAMAAEPAQAVKRPV
ncbi:PGPGW domain-containing protein [Streptomyces sp. GSL17-111]|uniref:PGPGW domain-containing protein n=1 Tax=Streptomyces sp. GSL17-111 TaxID=3121596 RepID=UPI0030F4536C